MITYYTANAVLNNIVGAYTNNQSISLAPTAYAALSTTVPTKSGTNVTEPTDSAYQRAFLGAYNNNTYAQHMRVSTIGETSNASEIHFTQSADDYASYCIYFCIYSAPTSGQLIAYSPITPYTTTSSTITGINVNGDIFVEAVTAVAGTDYVFSFDGTDWSYNSGVVDLADYGITITGTATSLDTITVTYGILPTANTIPLIRTGALTLTLN